MKDYEKSMIDLFTRYLMHASKFAPNEAEARTLATHLMREHDRLVMSVDPFAKADAPAEKSPVPEDDSYTFTVRFTRSKDEDVDAAHNNFPFDPFAVSLRKQFELELQTADVAGSYEITGTTGLP